MKNAVAFTSREQFVGAAKEEPVSKTWRGARGLPALVVACASRGQGDAVVSFAPLPEHYRGPPPQRAVVNEIIHRARRIVPGYGGARAVSAVDLGRLVSGAKVQISTFAFSSDCGAMLLPAWAQRPDRYTLFIDRRFRGGTRTFVLLHEIGHALGGHFGPDYKDREAGYPVWEREADLFAALGLLSATERSSGAAAIARMLCERVLLDSEWRGVRVPWISRALARRKQAVSARK